jgi:hypothetical protein
MQKSYKTRPVPRSDWSTPAPSDTLSSIQAAARTRSVRNAEQGTHRYAFAFDVQHDHAPALRSVIDEMAALIASRFGGKNTAQQEQAMTAAAVALGSLRAAVFALVPEGDPNYRSAHE